MGEEVGRYECRVMATRSQINRVYRLTGKWMPYLTIREADLLICELNQRKLGRLPRGKEGIMGVQQEGTSIKSVADIERRMADTMQALRIILREKTKEHFLSCGILEDEDLDLRYHEGEWMHQTLCIMHRFLTHNCQPATKQLLDAVSIMRVEDILDRRPKLTNCPHCGNPLIIEGEHVYQIAFENEGFHKDDGSITYRCCNCRAELDVKDIMDWLEAVDDA